MDYALCPPLRVPEGDALAGGSMETYLAGTSTPLATYADTAGTANPTTIPLDPSGRPDGAVYLAATDANGDPVAYKFIVRDASGQTVYTQDEVRAGGLQLFDFGNVVNLEDFPTLQDAVTAIGAAERTLVVSAPRAVAADTTVPANAGLLFIGEGRLDPAAGVTLTIEGPLAAGDRRIFGTDGAVVLGAGNRRVDPRWWGAAPEGDAGVNTTAFQAAFDAISVLPADTTATPRTGTGGRVVVSPGDYEIDGPVTSVSDCVELTGAGMATRILCSATGGFRFGFLEPGGDKNGAATNNVKHVHVRSLHIQALAGRAAGPLVDVPICSRFSMTTVRITSAEPTNLITGIRLAAFQGVSIHDCLVNVNAYPVHLLATGVDPEYEAHVTITDTELYLSGTPQAGQCAALHIEQGAGANDPIRDLRLDRVLMAAFTQDPNETYTVGLKITNPNVTSAVVGAVFTGCMFEQCETLMDASTYAPDDTSHVAFIGSAFLGKQGVTLAGWRGNDFKSRPYFEGCNFTNMADGIVQADPTLGAHNYSSGITGSLLSSITNARYNGLERPFLGQSRFRWGSSASVANGDTIPHGLIATPGRVLLTSLDSNHNVSVANKNATDITVGVRDVSGSLVGTPTTVYWEAAV
jgi:hypothetical protein